MMHPDYRNLYFVGMFQPLGCIWPGAELQAKVMARELAGKWQRPTNIYHHGRLPQVCPGAEEGFAQRLGE